MKDKLLLVGAGIIAVLSIFIFFKNKQLEALYVKLLRLRYDHQLDQIEANVKGASEKAYKSGEAYEKALNDYYSKHGVSPEPTPKGK